MFVKLLNLSLSQIFLSLPISSRPWSDSDVSGPPVPILGTVPSSGPPVPILGTMPSSESPVPVLNKPPSSGPPVPVINTLPSSGTPVPVLVKTPSSNNPTCPEPGTSLLFLSMLLPLHTCHCNHVYTFVKIVSHRYSCLFAYF